MLKKMVMMAVLAVSVVCGSLALTSGEAMAAVTCPTGSIHAGSQVTNIAECNVPKDQQDKGLMEYVQTGLNVVISIVGLVAVVVIILGGITFVTSQGDAPKITKAKNTILYGIVGLVIAILSFAIVNFVLSSVFSGGKSTGSGSDSGKTEGMMLSL